MWRMTFQEEKKSQSILTKMLSARLLNMYPHTRLLNIYHTHTHIHTPCPLTDMPLFYSILFLPIICLATQQRSPLFFFPPLFHLSRCRALKFSPLNMVPALDLFKRFLVTTTYLCSQTLSMVRLCAAGSPCLSISIVRLSVHLPPPAPALLFPSCIILPLAEPFQWCSKASL